MKYTATINKTNENTNVLFTTKGLRYISDEAAAAQKADEDRMINRMKERNNYTAAIVKKHNFSERLDAALGTPEFSKIWDEMVEVLKNSNVDEKYPMLKEADLFDIE